MALTFPLALATFWDAIKIESMSFDLATFQTVKTMADGTVVASQRATPRWQGEATLNVAFEDAAGVDALIGSLLGSINAFQGYDLARSYPKADPDGATLGSSSVTIHSVGSDGKSLKLTGLPAGYVLSVGDYISVPSRKALHQVVEASTANGSGVSPSFFEVRPPIRAGTIATDAVVLKKPYGFFRMVPGSLSPRSKTANVNGQISFRFSQVFQ